MMHNAVHSAFAVNQQKKENNCFESGKSVDRNQPKPVTNPPARNPVNPSFRNLQKALTA
jgi:hypothetical protein